MAAPFFLFYKYTVLKILWLDFLRILILKNRLLNNSFLVFILRLYFCNIENLNNSKSADGEKENNK